MAASVKSKLQEIKDSAPKADLETQETIAKETTETTDMAATPAQTPAATPVQSKAAQTVATRNAATEARLAYGQVREDLGDYAEAACFYAAASPVANSVGGELGVVTRDDKTGETYRTGVGLYLRSDHLCKLPFMGTVNI